MNRALTCTLAAAMLLGASAAAQQKPSEVKRINGRPDLSGLWTYSIDLPARALKQVVGGQTVIQAPDRSGRLPARVEVTGAVPSWTATPSYKPELQEKVKATYDNQTKTDNTFLCGRPGVPRLGPPRKIVQLPEEMIFLYEEMSGDAYRVIPTNGRKHNPDADPSYNGDAIGRWEGDVLVVESVNFVRNTWFGELGYFHSDAMKVTERLWRQGENLAYQVIVDDPKVLTQPWIMAPRLIKPSTEPLLETPDCVEDDAHRLANSDHHTQR
jgi:hypothetical protein